MDPISMVIAAGLLATGWLLGRYARLRRSPKPLQPVCLCGHHYGSHDPERGECMTEFVRTFNYQQVWRPCSCVRYTGPQPVEQYWVPPSADMSIVTVPRPTERRSPR